MSAQNFEFYEKVGEGAFSMVYRVKRRSDNQFYALKRVKFGNLSQREKENALNEVRILASFQHPNIIAYKEAFIDSQSNSLCIVMEYAAQGDLLSRINQHKKRRTYFQEREIWSLAGQIIKGLHALHEQNILHRDLKSANIFLDTNLSAKIGDLNVSKIAKQGLVYTQTGTPYYASPEVWRDKPYNEKSDIWSLGCILYEMAALSPPFTGKDMQELYKKVTRGSIPQLPNFYSNDLHKFIRRLLQVDFKLRPSCDRLVNMPEFDRFTPNIRRNKSLVDQSTPLLRTIRLDRNLRNLSARLPAPKYLHDNKENIFVLDAKLRNISCENSRQENRRPRIQHNQNMRLPPIAPNRRENY